jgi:hypothetical protein
LPPATSSASRTRSCTRKPRRHQADQRQQVLDRQGRRAAFADHFVGKITVPTYLAGAWQDEQTGGYFANLLDKFTGTKDAWFTAQNGNHTDALDPRCSRGGRSSCRSS